MKIALFTETYLPYINGVVTHVKALRDGLEKLGHTVMVVTANTDTLHHYIDKDGVLNCPAKIFKKVYNYGLASPLSLKRLRLLASFNPDIIHIHNEFGVGLSGTLIARQLKIPMVYTLHTMYDEYLYYVASERIVPTLKKISHKYVRFLARNASALTGPSNKVQNFFDNCGVQRSVSVVPNPVELDVFNPSRIDRKKSQKLREQLSIPTDNILISFCGRLGREKSVDKLLEYFAKNVKKDDKFSLMILGDGPCLADLENQASNLGITDMVRFIGKVEHNDLPEYYGACQLYITASLSDTNSISMKEAMATGLPVIHISDPLNAGQIIDGVNGYIYTDADDMYRVLCEFRDKTVDEKSELINSVISSVKIFGCEALAEYLVDVYKEAQDNLKYKKFNVYDPE